MNKIAGVIMVVYVCLEVAATLHMVKQVDPKILRFEKALLALTYTSALVLYCTFMFGLSNIPLVLGVALGGVSIILTLILPQLCVAAVKGGRNCV